MTMIPTLKKTHRVALQRKLQEFRENPEALNEAINQKQIDEMQKALKTLTTLFKAPEFKNLESFRLGLQKAQGKLNDILGSNQLMQWLKQGLIGSELDNVAKFTKGVTTLLRQLPQITDFVKNEVSIDDEKWNPDISISQMLSDMSGVMPGQVEHGAQVDKLRKLILKAMKPAGFMAGDLPYVSSEEAADELMALTYNQIKKLGEMASRSKNVRSLQHSDVLNKIQQSVMAAIQSTPEPGERSDVGSSIPSGKPRLTLPTEEPPEAPTAMPGAALDAGATSQFLLSTFNERFKAKFGEDHRYTDREIRFREDYTRAIMRWLRDNGLFAKKQSTR